MLRGKYSFFCLASIFYQILKSELQFKIEFPVLKTNVNSLCSRLHNIYNDQNKMLNTKLTYLVSNKFRIKIGALIPAFKVIPPPLSLTHLEDLGGSSTLVSLNNFLRIFNTYFTVFHPDVYVSNSLNVSRQFEHTIYLYF